MKDNEITLVKENSENITTDRNTINKELESLRKLSISEIDNYGGSIQERISTNSDNILEKVQINELGDTQDGIRRSLEDLQDISTKQNKNLPILGTALKRFKTFKGGYDKIQTRIDEITSTLENQQDKISLYIDYMLEQNESLDSSVKDLKIKEDSLYTYAEELQDGKESDQIRLQAVSNRLHLLSGTRVNAEQAQIETLMIVKQQQESKYQLQKVVQNVVPILKMQAVNAVGNRVNKETLELMKKTREVTGKIIEKNAQEIKNMAVALQDNQTKGAVDDTKLLNAQKTLTEALEQVTRASQLEAEANLRITNELREQSSRNREFINNLKITNSDVNEVRTRVKW
jgi:uncharacterized protein YaaN involved in tellurite resistance